MAIASTNVRHVRHSRCEEVRHTPIAGAYGIADEPFGLELFVIDCDLTGSAADVVIGEVADQVRGSEATARSNGIGAGEVTVFEPAFIAGLDALSRTRE